MAASAASADCAPSRVELRTLSGATAAFTVEIANTEALREHGLMDRAAMPADQGMLFTYDSPRHVWYWMKDTLIPLDMVFADPTGRVTSVHAEAQPQDLTPIDGGEGVAYVLEINGGLAARLGLTPGSALRTAGMVRDQALWPCR
jgi:hypothetical protein